MAKFSLIVIATLLVASMYCNDLNNMREELQAEINMMGDMSESNEDYVPPFTADELALLKDPNTPPEIRNPLQLRVEQEIQNIIEESMPGATVEEFLKSVEGLDQMKEQMETNDYSIKDKSTPIETQEKQKESSKTDL